MKFVIESYKTDIRLFKGRVGDRCFERFKYFILLYDDKTHVVYEDECAYIDEFEDVGVF